MNYILLLGANIGDAQVSFSRAIQKLSEATTIIKKSSLYQSEPWGFETDNIFTNQIIEVETPMIPINFLRFTQKIEIDLGRSHKTVEQKYQSRNIDIDILFCDNKVIDTPELTIPHPRLHIRRFTLIPLSELWSELKHPKLNKTIVQLLCECDDKGKVWRI